MMRAFILAAALVLPAAAVAEQIPKSRNEDPRVCDVPYDPNNVTKIVATIGDNITIMFGKDETIDLSGVGLSDGDPEHIARTTPDPPNLIYFKAKKPMPPQPIMVRTTKSSDSSHRLYQIEWSATDPPPPASPEPVDIASNSGPPTAPQPKLPPPKCWTVRYTYPDDVKAETAAKARVAWAKRKDDDAEIALRTAAIIAKNNIRYVGKGDAGLAPSEVWDNAGRDSAGGPSQPRTEMHFAGRIPAILRPSGDDAAQDAQIANVTIEDNGVVKIIGIYPLIRLRDGERVLCVINKAPAPASNVTSGTVSSQIERGLNTGHTSK